MKTLNKTSFVLAFGYHVYSFAETSQLLSGLHYFPVNTLLFVPMYQITLALHIPKLNRPLKLKQTAKVQVLGTYASCRKQRQLGELSNFERVEKKLV